MLDAATLSLLRRHAECHRRRAMPQRYASLMPPDTLRHAVSCVDAAL